MVHEITAAELAAKAGYSRPHILHCGPGGSFRSAWAGPTAPTGPAGSPVLDHERLDVVGAWSTTRGEQFFGYDGWWPLHHDTVITSAWATRRWSSTAWTPRTCSAGGSGTT